MRNASQVTVGAAIAAFLEQCEVKAAFGVISIHNMPILDAFASRGNIRFVMARGEAGAANMADAYARTSGGLGVCLTSTGTAAGNAAGALVEALTVALDQFGFYHDRFLAETKIDTARLSSSLRKLAEIPGLPVAPARSTRVLQQFIAARSVAAAADGCFARSNSTASDVGTLPAAMPWRRSSSASTLTPFHSTPR